MFELEIQFPTLEKYWSQIGEIEFPGEICLFTQFSSKTQPWCSYATVKEKFVLEFIRMGGIDQQEEKCK